MRLFTKPFWAYLDPSFNGCKWYRRWRGGVWYCRVCEPDMEYAPFLVWSRKPEPGQPTIDREDYRPS